MHTKWISSYNNLKNSLYIINKIQDYCTCQRGRQWEFPGGPVFRIPCFQCKGHGFDPWRGQNKQNKNKGGQQDTRVSGRWCRDGCGVKDALFFLYHFYQQLFNLLGAQGCLTLKLHLKITFCSRIPLEQNEG